MSTTANKTKTILKRMITGFCHRHQIRRFSIFGSFAAGDPKPGSDLDLLVSFNPKACPTLLDLDEMRAELVLLFGRSIDIVEEEALKNPYRRASILKSRKVLYAAHG